MRFAIIGLQVIMVGHVIGAPAALFRNSLAMKTTTFLVEIRASDGYPARSAPFILFSFIFLLPSPVLATLLAPLGAHHRVFQRVCVKLAPALQRLDFSLHGYMMSKPIDNQCKTSLIAPSSLYKEGSVLERLLILSRVCPAVLRRRIHGAGLGDASDSEEELAAFCPSVRLFISLSIECCMLIHLLVLIIGCTFANRFCISGITQN